VKCFLASGSRWLISPATRFSALVMALALAGPSSRWETDVSRFPRSFPGPDWAVMSTVTGPPAQLSSDTFRPSRFRFTGPSDRWRMLVLALALAAED